MDMQHGHAVWTWNAAWTWTRNTGLVMQHGLVNAAWIWTVDMHECWNADKKLSLPNYLFWLFVLHIQYYR
jgi:hypothetical protein